MNVRQRIYWRLARLIDWTRRRVIRRLGDVLCRADRALADANWRCIHRAQGGEDDGLPF